MIHDPKAYKKVSLAGLRDMVQNKNILFGVVRDKDHVIGMGLVIIITKPRGRTGYLEEMVVDEAYRGRGIGTDLTKKLIAFARAKKVSHIELTSRPHRTAAIALYESVGFKQKETNVYRLVL